MIVIYKLISKYLHKYICFDIYYILHLYLYLNSLL